MALFFFSWNRRIPLLQALCTVQSICYIVMQFPHFAELRVLHCFWSEAVKRELVWAPDPVCQPLAFVRVHAAKWTEMDYFLVPSFWALHCRLEQPIKLTVCALFWNGIINTFFFLHMAARRKEHALLIDLLNPWSAGKLIFQPLSYKNSNFPGAVKTF